MAYSISDTAPVLDYDKAINDLGDEGLFNTLLESYDSTLLKTLDELQVAMDSFDYKEIRMKAHSLKGPSSYIQAERVRRASEVLQQCVDKQEGSNTYKYYAQLIKECISLRRRVRQYLCKLNSNEGIVKNNRPGVSGRRR